MNLRFKEAKPIASANATPSRLHTVVNLYSASQNAFAVFPISHVQGLIFLFLIS